MIYPDFYTYLTEMSQKTKDDSLHGFAKYLVHSLVPGKLDNSGVEYLNWVNVISDASEDEFKECDAYKEFSDDDCLKDQFEWFVVHEIDENYSDYYADIEEYIKKNEDVFIDWIKETAIDNISNGIEVTEDGLVFVERVITIMRHDNIMEKTGEENPYFEYLKGEFKGSLGHYWTYAEDRGDAYSGDILDGDYVTIRGYVRNQDVDWIETACFNVWMPDEMELRLKDNTMVQISSVKIRNKNDYSLHTIWNRQGYLAKTD